MVAMLDEPHPGLKKETLFTINSFRKPVVVHLEKLLSHELVFARSFHAAVHSSNPVRALSILVSRVGLYADGAFS
jgi:hypothetical protein